MRMRKSDYFTDWDDLRVFLAVARTGSFTDAAKYLGNVQSTIGRRIFELERRVGSKLFDRHGKGVRLTPLGTELMDRAEAVDDTITKIERRLVGGDRALEGTVRMTTTDGFASFWVMPRVLKFHREYPKIRLEVMASQVWFNLGTREADVAIRFAKQTDRRIAATRIGPMSFSLFSSRKYLDKAGTPKNLSEIDDHVVIDNLNLHSNPSFADWTSIVANHPKLALSSNSATCIVSAIHAGTGIAILPTFYGAVLPDLVPLNIKINATSEIWLLSHTETNKNARVRAVLNFFGNELKAGHKMFAPRFQG